MGYVQLGKKLIADRSAVTALEYGIVAAFFVVVLVTIFTKFGSTLTSMYSGVTTSL